MITVYSTPECQACKATKRMLDRSGVTYREVDVAANPVLAAHLREQGYRVLPVVEFDVAGNRGAFSGLRPDAVKNLIRISTIRQHSTVDRPLR